MYISYRSIEEAKNEALCDAITLGPLLKQAASDGSEGIILNSDAGIFFLENKEHSYRVYLDTLISRLPNTYWEISHKNDKVMVILKFRHLYDKLEDYKKAA
ncbi:MAG TPA: hypothetical protein PKA63_02750 [Oligoflexia bacterium]|nr:hypothetical protein [Oligoflexia bacterium]HMP47572.1 hypothetical protein [Oligoflexia bacterium]